MILGLCPEISARERVLFSARMKKVSNSLCSVEMSLMVVDAVTVISSTAFNNLTNGSNAVMIPLTPDPEYGYLGK